MKKRTNRIQELRISKGYKTGAEVAKTVGAAYQSYSAWEGQRHNPSLFFQTKLAQLFEVTIPYLLGQDIETKTEI